MSRDNSENREKEGERKRIRSEEGEVAVCAPRMILKTGESQMRESKLLPPLTYRRALDQWMQARSAGRCPPAYRGKVTVYRKMVAKLRRIGYNTDADISSEAASSPIPVSVPYGST